MIDKKITDDIGILILEDPPQNYLQKPEFIPVPELRDHIRIRKAFLRRRKAGFYFCHG
jgi:hypothetical protein